MRLLLIAALLLGGCRTNGSGDDATVKDAAPVGSSHEHAAVHGMYLFGTDKIYLSHLPLFSAPHNYQVILEVEMSAKDAYLADRLTSGAKIYTFNPQPFVLSRLWATTNPLTSFKGTIYRNHFEDGHDFAPLGAPFLDDVQVTVKRVVYQQKLDPNGAAPSALSELLFGHGSEIWAAHVVTHVPDFDQFVAVTPPAGAYTDDQLAQGVPFTVAGRDNTLDKKLTPGEQVTAGNVNLTIGAETYLEVGDLSQ